MLKADLRCVKNHISHKWFSNSWKGWSLEVLPWLCFIGNKLPSCASFNSFVIYGYRALFNLAASEIVFSLLYNVMQYCRTYKISCICICSYNVDRHWQCRTALVLVPTHELCLQVLETLQKLLHRFHWIVPGYIMGGENRSKEKARLRKGRN